MFLNLKNTAGKDSEQDDERCEKAFGVNYEHN